MLLQTSPTKEDFDYFSNRERPGVQIAKDIYSLINENFAAIDTRNNGCITDNDIATFRGNQRLKEFLNKNIGTLSHLSFTARNLSDLMRDSVKRNEHALCVSYSDLNTFSWLAEDINRKNFYDGNFQSLREGVGLNSSAIGFLAGIIIGWAMLAYMFAKLHLMLPPTEAIGIGVIATVGIPLLFALAGYLYGTAKADKYFEQRISKIDQILEQLEGIN